MIMSLCSNGYICMQRLALVVFIISRYHIFQYNNPTYYVIVHDYVLTPVELQNISVGSVSLYLLFLSTGGDSSTSASPEE